MTTFRVVIEGSVLQGFGLDDVRRRLASLIGRSDDVAGGLLGGRPSTVKREIDEATALRYVEALKKIGVSCHAEQETLDLDLDAPQIASAFSAGAATAPTPIRPPRPSQPGVEPVDASFVNEGVKTTRYVESVIGKGEIVLYRARLSLLSFWLWFVFGGLLVLSSLGLIAGSIASKTTSLGGFVFGELAVAALLFLRPILARLTTELVITNRRIIAKFGIISRSTIELNLSKIESIRVEQGLLGRLLNYGDVMVIGTGGSQEPIKRISHPLEFRRRYAEILASTQGKEA